MSVTPDDPSIRTDHEAANLGKIIQVAGSAVVEETRKIGQHQMDQRAEDGAKYVAQSSNNGNVEAGLYGDIGMELIGGSLGALGKLAKDALTVADDRGWFGFGEGAGTKASFPLTDRIQNVSKFFSGASDVDDQKFPPQTAGMQGKQDIQVTYASRMLNQQKYEQALALQQQYAVELGHRNRIGLGATGPSLGGYSPNLMMTPKAPNFKGAEEDATNWGAGNVTG